jgi:hypothetical protein
MREGEGLEKDLEPSAEAATGREARLSEPVDMVNHPPHYKAHPSGVECIQITEHMGFNLGNAVKYIWRADEKGNAVEDLKKAAWYIAREIERRTKARSAPASSQGPTPPPVILPTPNLETLK